MHCPMIASKENNNTSTPLSSSPDQNIPHNPHNLAMLFSSNTNQDDNSDTNIESPTTTTCSSNSSIDSISISNTPRKHHQQTSPYTKSPWKPWSHSHQHHLETESIIREDGHVYALATSKDLLYTCSESKNIRVWKNLQEFSGFKSKSGFVKAIVVSGDKIYTGHQDGKIRVWKFCGYNKKKLYKRVGSLPTLKDCITGSVNPKSYVKGRRNRNVPWIKHFDAVSCIAVDADEGLLYSGSWDKTVKVWRTSDSKCLESINAHDDAVNAVVVGFDGLIFTGSADGTLRVWRRQISDNHTEHKLTNTLLKQDTAVTSLAANVEASVVYAGSSDGLVNFWEREKWDVIAAGGVLRGHKMAVLCLAVGGSLVLSGSVDNSICVWRREDGGVHTCLSVLTGHDGPVKCLAMTVDGDSGKENRRWVVYSGSLDNTVKVWRVSEEQEVDGDDMNALLSPTLN